MRRMHAVAFLIICIIMFRFQPRVPGGAVRAAQAEVAARGGQGGHGGAPVPGHRAQVAAVVGDIYIFCLYPYFDIYNISVPVLTPTPRLFLL